MIKLWMIHIVLKWISVKSVTFLAWWPTVAQSLVCLFHSSVSVSSSACVAHNHGKWPRPSVKTYSLKLVPRQCFNHLWQSCFHLMDCLVVVSSLVGNRFFIFVSRNDPFPWSAALPPSTSYVIIKIDGVVAVWETVIEGVSSLTGG